jgi:hypothetical protein
MYSPDLSLKYISLKDIFKYFGDHRENYKSHNEG